MWAASEDALFLYGIGGGGAAAAADRQQAAEEHGVADFAEQFAALRIPWGEDDVLEELSGIKKPRPAAANKGKGTARATDAKNGAGGSSKPAAVRCNR